MSCTGLGKSAWRRANRRLPASLSKWQLECDMCTSCEGYARLQYREEPIPVRTSCCLAGSAPPTGYGQGVSLSSEAHTRPTPWLTEADQRTKVAEQLACRGIIENSLPAAELTRLTGTHRQMGYGGCRASVLRALHVGSGKSKWDSWVGHATLTATLMMRRMQFLHPSQSTMYTSESECVLYTQV